MLAKKYLSKVVELTNPIDGIYTVSFQSQGRQYKYKPGQFLHLSIDSQYDGIGQWPESRCFSMQSSPGELNLKITYSVKGAYTGLMEKSLGVGSDVWLKMPYGDLFQQQHDKTNTVFIAGGTGITPFLSLLTYESFQEYINPKIYLGFRSQTFNLYKKELAGLCNSSKLVNFFYEDIDGLLDIKYIFYENGKNSNYFISGPPDMIKNFRHSLITLGVASENIFTDNWE